MTIAEALISTQEAVANMLLARSELTSLVSGVYDYFTEKTPGFPYIVFGPISPEYVRVEGEVEGGRTVTVALTLWVFDDSPSKLPVLEVLKQVELALADKPLLSYGTAAAAPTVVIRGAEYDDALGLWRTPVEVRLMVGGV